MMSSIQVEPRLERGKLDPMSRINFAKIYMVEHNVKVFDFGIVHSDSMPVLKNQWQYTLKLDTTGQIESPTDPTVATQITEEAGESDGESQRRMTSIFGFGIQSEVESESRLKEEHEVWEEANEELQGQRARPETYNKKEAERNREERRRQEDQINDEEKKSQKELLALEEQRVQRVRETPEQKQQQMKGSKAAAVASKRKEPLTENFSPPRGKSAKFSYTRSTSNSSTDSIQDQMASSVSGEERSVSDSMTTVGPDAYQELLPDNEYSDIPPDVDLDERLVHPERWRSRLETLESRIVILLKFREASFAEDFMTVATCADYLTTVLAGLQMMRDAGYSNGSITCLIVSPVRPTIASLCKIEDTKIIQLKHSLERFLKENKRKFWIASECKDFIRSTGLDPDIDVENILRVLTTLIARWLCLCTISYCGAHVENFDKAYRNPESESFTLAKGFVFHRRRLKCMNEMLGNRPVWVLEQFDLGFFSRSSEEVLKSFEEREDLFILTTVDSLVDTWGPAWKIADPANPDTCRRIGIGNGYIVPSSGLKEVSPRRNEISCHWTSSGSEAKEASPFSQDIMNRSLLIGAGQCLHVRHECRTEPEEYARRMEEGEGDRLHELGTSKPVVERERTINTQLGFAGVSVVGASIVNTEHHKLRSGRTYREAFLEMWTMDPAQRNPSVLKKLLGVEVSICTGNARRCTLLVILGSDTMRNYLASVGYWTEIPVGLEQQYFELLNDSDPNAFPNCFLRPPESLTTRKVFGGAIALSLEILKYSCTDADDCLSVVWAPDSENTWSVLYPIEDYGWTGVLRDSQDRFSMAVVSAKCLEFDAKSTAAREDWSSHCRKVQPNHNHSVLESMLYINEQAELPKGLAKTYDEDGHGSWKLEALELNGAFEMGDGDNLVFMACLKSPVFSTPVSIIVGWESPKHTFTAFRKLKQRAQKAADVLKTTTKYRHHEAQRKSKSRTDPIVIYIVSNPRGWS
jgi:hypothetical protein